MVVLIKKTYIITSLILFCSYLASGQNEAFYIDKISGKLGGETEKRVENGRVDIVTNTHAIEVEWASNWKHSIGQALWYAMQTNKKPGIVLIMKDVHEWKHGIRLQSALDYAGLTNQIDVWFYPEDFGGSFQSEANERSQYRQNLIETNGNYTRNKNSGVRHNSKCTYFNCANCVPSGPAKGKACGKCGG